MKLLWLQDLSPYSHDGGAQLNDRAKILAGLRRGHEIEVVVPESSAAIADWGEAAVASNCTAFTPQVFEALSEKGKPYVFFLHDYAPVCKVRLFYPQLPKCKTCFRKERWLPALQAARLLIWLSPLHRRAWLYSCPELREHAYLLNPSTVSADEFYDMGLERAGTLAVNSGLDFKGRVRFVEWAEEHPEEPITLIGPTNATLPPNVTRRENMVPAREMNRVYNEHERFVHLPVNAMPFDRTPVEALLAGCKLVLNKNVGCLSWGFMRQGREAVEAAMRNADGDFWDAVEGALV